MVQFVPTLKKVVVKILKTMYQQFVEGSQAKVIEYGFVNKDYSRNHRFYTYVNDENTYNMLVYVNTPLAFTPHQLTSLIATDIVKIEAIEFKTITQRRKRNESTNVN